MGSGASTTGGSGLDGVGVRGGGKERELDARGLRYLRDGKGASALKRTRQRHSRRAAEAAPLLSGQTSSASAAAGVRRAGMGWTAAVHRLVYGWVTLGKAASEEWARVPTGVSTRRSHGSAFQFGLYLFLQPHLSRRWFLLLTGAVGAGAPGGCFATRCSCAGLSSS